MTGHGDTEAISLGFLVCASVLDLATMFADDVTTEFLASVPLCLCGPSSSVRRSSDQSKRSRMFSSSFHRWLRSAATHQSSSVPTSVT